jgi:ubiquinone/menaquinone biosynthesis C-methylase UbiE
MEERKQKEIEYYNKKAVALKEENLEEGDFEKFNPFVISSYDFLKTFLKDKCRDKKILDYGCGHGIHSKWLKEAGGNVVGIDLSDKSLEIAKEKVKGVDFIQMDCENLDFPDNHFDIVFDGGTFSSLSINKAFAEISRVLKKDGFLVGIETLGHNPVLNLKRKINKLVGKRTGWAESHIFKMKDIKMAEEYFGKKETYFFHLFSWIAFPFLDLRIGRFVLKLLERADKFFTVIFPFLKRYSFKIVFVFSEPKKDEKIV